MANNNIELVITNEGLAALVNAENNGTADVVLSEIGFGTGKYTATPTQTALTEEFKRINTLSGGVDPVLGLLHVNIRDDSDDIYEVYEIGIYTDDGILFAVYSQDTPIISKSLFAVAMFTADILLSIGNPENITIGDTNFLLNAATTETAGLVELATEAEAKAGTDDTRVITPKTLAAVINNGGGTTNKAIRITVSSPSIAKTDNFGSLVLCGGTSQDDGGALVLQGKNSASNPGSFTVSANNGTAAKGLTGNADGTLKWDGVNIVRSINGNFADESGNITAEQTGCLPLSGGAISNQISITRNVSDSYLGLFGGTGERDGAELDLCGKDHSSHPGGFILHARNGEVDYRLRGEIDGILWWNDKYVLNNSFSMPINNSGIIINGGTAYESGAYLRLYGNDHSTGNGNFRIGTNNYNLIGTPDGKLTWRGKVLPQPVGTILLYAGTSAPEGYLACNGGGAGRTNYPELFALLGTTYGEGNGSTTFNVPKLTAPDSKMIYIIKY